MEQEKSKQHNPFSDKNSGYGKSIGGKLVSAYPEGSGMHAFHKKSLAYITSLIGYDTFACVAGQAAVKAESFALGVYKDMKDPKVAEGVCHDLLQFNQEFDIPDKEKGPKGLFRSYIAAFEGPVPTSQMDATNSLYTLLKNMHKADAKHFSWSKEVSSDTQSPNFGYSIAGVPYFVVYFHPFTSSPARQSDMTFVVFNANAMFDVLRKQGKFEKLKQIIRGRQKYIHPHLGEYGEVNVWLQYGLVDPDDATQEKEKKLRRQVLGKCPFGKPQQ